MKKKIFELKIVLALFLATKLLIEIKENVCECQNFQWNLRNIQLTA